MTYPVELLATHGTFGLAGGILALQADGPLGRTGDTILVPFDQIMLPDIIKNAGWQLEELEFIARMTNPAQQYVLIDVGANTGLFTRQISRRLTNISHYFCVEADPENYKALQYNLASLKKDSCDLYNIALTDRNEPQPFFRDASNCGNYSTNIDAMTGHVFDTVFVQAAKTDEWMAKILARVSDERIIWKSDTQGCDELIVSLTPMAVWERVDVAIVELWRIEKPSFDQDAFRARIDQFPYKSIGISDPVGSDDVISYLEGRDYWHNDLYLWR